MLSLASSARLVRQAKLRLRGYNQSCNEHDYSLDQSGAQEVQRVPVESQPHSTGKAQSRPRPQRAAPPRAHLLRLQLGQQGDHGQEVGGGGPRPGQQHQGPGLDVLLVQDQRGRHCGRGVEVREQVCRRGQARADRRYLRSEGPQGSRSLALMMLLHDYYTVSAPLAAKGAGLPVVLFQDVVLDLLVPAHLRKLAGTVLQVLYYQRLLGQRNGQLSHRLQSPPQGLELRRPASFEVAGQVEAGSVGEREGVGLEGRVEGVRGELGAVGGDCAVDVVEGGEGGGRERAAVGVQSYQVSVGTVGRHARQVRICAVDCSHMRGRQRVRRRQGIPLRLVPAEGGRRIGGLDGEGEVGGR